MARRLYSAAGLREIIKTDPGGLTRIGRAGAPRTPVNEVDIRPTAACLAVAGLVAHAYGSIIGTIAVTVSAVNGTISLWKLVRCRGRYAHS